jgi:hypothetical protein
LARLSTGKQNQFILGGNMQMSETKEQVKKRAIKILVLVLREIRTNDIVVEECDSSITLCQDEKKFFDLLLKWKPKS